MVYTGKPSRACQTCKNRRIKCDEKRPICGQCTKSKRHCPGYPDEFDLVFRDENKAMHQRKVRKTALRRESSHQTSSSTEVSPRSSFDTSTGTGPYPGQDSLNLQFIPESTQYEHQLSIVPSPPCKSSSFLPGPFTDSTFPLSPIPPDTGPGRIEEILDEQDTHAVSPKNGHLALIPHNPTSQARATVDHIVWNLENAVPPTITLAPEFEAVPFFFKNFISLPQQAESMRGFLELVVPFYNQARPSSAMHLATTAVALACFGNYPGRAEQLKDAVTTYGKALRKVKEDLQDPVMSRSDETVLAILMFSLYETIMSTDSSIKAWGNHVDGAVALTKLRGPDQLKDPMSLAVFRAVRTVMITSCVQRSKPIDDFPSQAGWRGNDLSEENAANRLTVICIDLPNLRARANTLTSKPYSSDLEQEARSIMHMAEMVDANLENWYLTLPPEWQYRTVSIVYSMPEDVSEAESWIGPQHAYHDVPLASIINDYRVCRIFCQRVISACIQWLNFRDSLTDRQTYEKAIYVIQNMVDEISAGITFHLTYDMQPVAKELGQEQNAAEAFGGYSLVWPLYVAANTETIPQRQRDWLSGRLYSIGTRFGLSSAQVLVLARRHVLNCGPMFP